eukprot:jgi/Chrzof1/7716/Cz02g34020.t1
MTGHANVAIDVASPLLGVIAQHPAAGLPSTPVKHQKTILYNKNTSTPFQWSNMITKSAVMAMLRWLCIAAGLMLASIVLVGLMRGVFLVGCLCAPHTFTALCPATLSAIAPQQAAALQVSSLQLAGMLPPSTPSLMTQLVTAEGTGGHDHHPHHPHQGHIEYTALATAQEAADISMLENIWSDVALTLAGFSEPLDSSAQHQQQHEPAQPPASQQIMHHRHTPGDDDGQALLVNEAKGSSGGRKLLDDDTSAQPGYGGTFLYNDFTYTDYDRVDGTGSYGRVFNNMMQLMNNNAQDAPQVGATAQSATNASGSSESHSRTANVNIQNQPLRAAGMATGGATSTDQNTSRTDIYSRTSAVAKGIVDDAGGEPVTAGAAGSAQGWTNATKHAGSSSSQSVGTSTTGGTLSSAGEQAVEGVPDSVPLSDALTPFRVGKRDGGSTVGSTSGSGTGDMTSSRLQSAAMGSTTDSESETKTGGSVLRASTDTTDKADLPATPTYGSSNSATSTRNYAASDRDGYSRGTGTGSATAVSTDASCAAVRGGSFGTGFSVDQASASSTTYLDPCDNSNNPDSKQSRCRRAAPAPPSPRPRDRTDNASKSKDKTDNASRSNDRTNTEDAQMGRKL